MILPDIFFDFTGRLVQKNTCKWMRKFINKY